MFLTRQQRTIQEKEQVFLTRQQRTLWETNQLSVLDKATKDRSGDRPGVFDKATKDLFLPKQQRTVFGEEGGRWGGDPKSQQMTAHD